MSDEPKSGRRRSTSVSAAWKYVRVHCAREKNPVFGWVPKAWWRRQIRGNSERIVLSPVPGAEPDMIVDSIGVFSITALDWTTGERRGCVKEVES